MGSHVLRYKEHETEDTEVLIYIMSIGQKTQEV